MWKTPCKTRKAPCKTMKDHARGTPKRTSRRSHPLQTGPCIYIFANYSIFHQKPHNSHQSPSFLGFPHHFLWGHYCNLIRSITSKSATFVFKSIFFAISIKPDSILFENSCIAISPITTVHLFSSLSYAMRHRY